MSQLATYAGVAIVWSRVLTRVGYPLRLSTLYPLAIAKLFADQAVPSGGVSGAAFFFHALGRRAVPNRIAFSVFVFATTAFFVAFLSAAMISFAALAFAGGATPALSASVAAFAAVILFLLVCVFAIFVLGFKAPSWVTSHRRYEDFSRWIATATRQISAHRRLFLEATIIQLAVRFIDGLTLYLAFMAIGYPAPFAACFVAVAMASVAATVAPMPMGLGTFEAGMIATLSVFGVSVENALTATLVFRGLSLWLPLAPGFFIIQREILRKKVQA